MSKRYHYEHPTISFRCTSREEYKKIKEMVKNSGKSESTFVREILLDAEKVESQSYSKGFSYAFGVINVPCVIYKESIILDLKSNSDAYKKTCDALKTFAHNECIEKQKKEKEAEKQRKAKE